jgi:hypothetical protein
VIADKGQANSNMWSGLIQGGTQAAGQYASGKAQDDQSEFERQKWEDEKAMRENKTWGNP